MSVKVTSWVWEHSQAKGSARLVLLALADHAGADGGDAYPSVRRLAVRCGVSERTVQEALKVLAELGEIEVRQNAGPHGTNRYRVNCTPAESAPPQISHPRNMPQGPPQISHQTPAESAPEPSLTVIEPSPSSSSSDQRTVPTTVWRKVAERQLANRKGDPISDKTAWLRKAARNAKTDQGVDAQWIWTTYDITESQLISVLLGSRGLLGSIRRRSPLPQENTG